MHATSSSKRPCLTAALVLQLVCWSHVHHNLRLRISVFTRRTYAVTIAFCTLGSPLTMWAYVGTSTSSIHRSPFTMRTNATASTIYTHVSIFTMRAYASTSKIYACVSLSATRTDATTTTTINTKGSPLSMSHLGITHFCSGTDCLTLQLATKIVSNLRIQ